MMKLIRALAPYFILIGLVVLIRFFIVTPVRVNGVSMEATMSNGDVLLLHKLHGQINRFDIVVVNLEDQRVVKRVVGMPTETIRYEDNLLYVNEELVEDDYFIGETFDFTVDFIPEDHYFVLGDNREDSLDSRIVGMINRSDIIGKTRLRIYPFNNLGPIG